MDSFLHEGELDDLDGDMDESDELDDVDHDHDENYEPGEEDD